MLFTTIITTPWDEAADVVHFVLIPCVYEIRIREAPQQRVSGMRDKAAEKIDDKDAK